jgi:plasmid stabilization system protein ParE
MFKISITEPAEADIRSAYNWWRINRSPEQADRWHAAIHKAIRRLKVSAASCDLVHETALSRRKILQRAVGIGRRPTHRIVFTIDDGVVYILRVRHAAQHDLTERDLL